MPNPVPSRIGIVPTEMGPIRRVTILGANGQPVVQEQTELEALLASTEEQRVLALAMLVEALGVLLGLPDVTPMGRRFNPMPVGQITAHIAKFLGPDYIGARFPGLVVTVTEPPPEAPMTQRSVREDGAGNPAQEARDMLVAALVPASFIPSCFACGSPTSCPSCGARPDAPVCAYCGRRLPREMVDAIWPMRTVPAARTAFPRLNAEQWKGVDREGNESLTTYVDGELRTVWRRVVNMVDA